MFAFDLKLMVCVVAAVVTMGYGLPTTAVEVAQKDLKAKTLLEFGNAFNNSLLKLIGHAFVNMEKDVQVKLCHVSSCDPWSVWTPCSARMPRSFGFQTRQRECWYDDKGSCNKEGNVTVEHDSRVCEGMCGVDYTVTRHGFCIKINNTDVSKMAAEFQCTKEGGHLMNMDTQERWDDFIRLAKEVGRDSIWIDGTRESAGGSWSYLSGLDPSANGVDEWKSGEPSNGSAELCKVAEISGGIRYWWDRDCPSNYSFVCEIRAV